MGLMYNVYLNANKVFGCKQCKTHLADYNDIVSRVRYVYLTWFWKQIFRKPKADYLSFLCRTFEDSMERPIFSIR